MRSIEELKCRKQTKIRINSRKTLINAIKHVTTTIIERQTTLILIKSLKKPILVNIK